MSRRRHHEEHVNHEAWAIPYGDLITLLAFFVVMYAMSTLNEGKYRVLADALNAEFRGPQRSTEPIQVGEQQRVAAKGDGVLDKSALLEGKSAQLVAPPQDHQVVTDREQLKAPRSTPADEVAGNAEQLNEVADEVEAAMSSLIRDKLVSVRRHGLWIEVEIKTDILFSSGVATLSPLATSLLLPLGDALRPFPNPIRVEGHTDNIPISKREFASNWELSAARSASVVRLFANLGVEPSRLTVIGLGEFRPLKSNATAEGRSANRRVVLVILGSDGLPAGTYGHQESEGAAKAVAPPEAKPSG